jgi:hypothetical protein
MSYKVWSFSKGQLLSCLANDFVTADFIDSNKGKFAQSHYLAGYLEKLEAKTIIEEPEYVDGDYLEDYSTYYVSCFDKYKNRCKRLHFFKEVISEADFDKWLRERSPESDEHLRATYLGFVVARPLPQAVIGRTEVKTYDDEPRRCYPACRHYDVNLFGIDLHMHSLAYQQQDTVVAACATVSLWSAFHKTNELFKTPVVRPATITTSANTIIYRRAGRAMPSRSLSTEQMIEAIRRIGLEPLLEPVVETTPLMSMIYGYLEFGIPVILMARLKEAGYQGHAVTVTGFRIGDRVPQWTEPLNSDVDTKARRIERLYIHDDNLGPFARVFPQAVEASFGTSAGLPSAYWPPFQLQSFDADMNPEHTLFPAVVMAPVYGKIRITFTDAHSWVQRLTVVLGLIGVNCTSFVWDIKLTTTQRFKSLLRERYSAMKPAMDMLSEPQPRFIWRAVACRGENEIVELLIDGTGISRSCPVFGVLWHDPAFQADMKAKLSGYNKADVAKAYTQRFADLLYA